MSSLTVFMIFMGAVVTFMGVICPFFSLPLFFKGLKGDEGPAVS